MKNLIIKCISLLCAGLLVCLCEFIILYKGEKAAQAELDRVAVYRYNSLTEAFIELEYSVYAVLTEKNTHKFVSSCYTAASSADDAKDALDEICRNEELKQRGMSFLGECREFFIGLAENHYNSAECTADEYNKIASIYAVCKPAADDIKRMQTEVNSKGQSAVEKIFSVTNYIKAANSGTELSYFFCDSLFYKQESKYIEANTEEPFYKPSRTELLKVLDDYCKHGSVCYPLVRESDIDLRFSTSSSCIIIEKNTARAIVLSRVKINKEPTLSAESCLDEARAELGKLSEEVPAITVTRFFEGIYYFDFLYGEENRITIGIDSSDGNVSFIDMMRYTNTEANTEVIRQEP